MSLDAQFELAAWIAIGCVCIASYLLGRIHQMKSDERRKVTEAEAREETAKTAYLLLGRK